MIQGGSEKLMCAIRSGAIPIFNENDDMSCSKYKKPIEYFFNKKRLINVKDFKDFDEMADHVKYLLNNKEILYKMMDEPVFNDPIPEEFKLFTNPPSDYYLHFCKDVKEKIINYK